MCTTLSTSVIPTATGIFEEGQQTSEDASATTLVQPQVTAWYSGQVGQRWDDPAREAYEAAVAILRQNLTPKEWRTIRLDDQASIAEVHHTIVHAQAEYEKKSKKSSKARIWLARCSAVIMHYGTVMDVLVQQSPEYVSLAWGAMKFLFTAVLNHEELLAEISKAVSRIGDALPRAELHVHLYPTERMKGAIAVLYAKIINFVLCSISYYKKNRFSKSVAAVIKPFALSLRGIVEDINESSRRVDELANSASKAELRDLRKETLGLRAEVQDLRFQVRDMAFAQRAFQDRVFLNMSGDRQNFEILQLENIQALPGIEDLPSPERSLQYCQLMTRRRRARVRMPLEPGQIRILKDWMVNEGSSIINLEARGVRTSSRDLAADLLTALVEAEIPVAWLLPGSLDEENATIEQLFASLVLQLIKINPVVLSDHAHRISAAHFKGQRNLDDWLGLLGRCLKGLKRVFVVLDLVFMRKLLRRENSMQIEEFIEKMEDVSESQKGVLKVIVLTWKSDADYNAIAQTLSEGVVVGTDPGARKVRLFRNPKVRAAYLARSRSSSRSFGWITELT